MLVGLALVCVLGTHDAGGATSVYETAKEIGRLNFNKWVDTALLLQFKIVKKNGTEQSQCLMAEKEQKSQYFNCLLPFYDTGAIIDFVKFNETSSSLVKYDV